MVVSIPNIVTHRCHVCLKDAICKFMQTVICAANCVFIARLADIYFCSELRASAKRFMKRNFEDVCRTEDWLELGVGDVEELISCDNIYVQTEETVVEAIQLWLARWGGVKSNIIKIGSIISPFAGMVGRSTRRGWCST